MRVKSRRVTLAAVRGNRWILGRVRSLSAINNRLSKQVNFQRVLKDSPVIEVKDGIATNINYTNPQHLKWLED
ncbi:hypothetical protein [Neobacillus cucumis]|uniref:hypothetical protein n=1 Tax=Neobacillus cucumis TaxID=1740721 RepID=UPI002E1FC0EE|nr:hypothetical protein [Neobacillus cucumis]